MSEEELATIETRCRAATPGPWRCDEDYLSVSAGPEGNDEFVFMFACPTKDEDCSVVRGEVWMVSVKDEELDEWLGEMIDGRPSPEDATFVAHARQDVPALVAEVRRLRKELAELKEAHR